MPNLAQMPEQYRRTIFILLALSGLLPCVSPAIALFLGLAVAMTIGCPFPRTSRKISKYLLQASVVGLGFGMNLHESLRSGRDGMLFTIVSVTAVLLLGYLAGRALKVETRTAYLIAAGTAICGGSAIAAVSPIVGADNDEISISLGTVFVLNAIALFIFPTFGHMLDLTQQQFGTWAAIAIHDTSSVVGAGAAYGPQALEVATMVKLTRTLWIIPMAFATTFFFKRSGMKVQIPWFIA